MLDYSHVFTPENVQSHSDLDLDPTDLENNRVPLGMVVKAYTKFKTPRVMRCLVIDRKSKSYADARATAIAPLFFE